MTVSVIIPAAGKGERTGFERNKLLYPLPLSDVPCLEKTVQAFVREDITQIIVAVSAQDEEEVKKLLFGYPVQLMRGGQTRTKSVQNALAAVTGEIVLIHDGARPFVSEKIITDCIESVKAFRSGICALPVTDTVVQAKEGEIVAVPKRSELYAVQTPQGFFTSDMVAAYSKIGDENFTDDSTVYAKFIGKPRLFLGERENVKLTFSQDFSSPAARTGIGIDTHAFGKEQNYIVLAGVKVPSESGLIAHSDGDVLLHAVMDALLSAAGLRDIGHYFPDTDEKWHNADSMEMLKIVLTEIHKAGYAPLNLSVAIQAQKPRLAKYIPAMTDRLAEVLALSPSAVGITAGTNEGLGYVGEGKGITVTANVLLQKK
jgi:2-C-methyl-D-erythritol 4-phosphate cytidylyltransferase/2-C-methyl-D-erythritol 2,4-cyclodiphosphate synthase